MAGSADGMNYAPKGKPSPVVKPGEFVFAAVALDHGHINGMANALTEAGAKLKWVYDPDPKKVEAFLKSQAETGVKAARSLDEVLSDKEVHMVAAAGIPNERGPLGLKVMDAGKDYFVDKAPFTSLDQLEAAKAKAKSTGKKYMVYYSERLHSECAVHAGKLVKDGAIGRVVQVIGMGPHRSNPPSRPDWFFKKAQYGGILTDIGSHQCEQFLFFSGAKDATVKCAQVGNYNHPKYPELEDFGDCTFVADNGATNYFRVDWLTPDGLSNWGDGRTFILGTEGYIELRKYMDVGRGKGSQLVIVDKKSEKILNVDGQVGYPFFGELVLDMLHRTEKAMTQEHAFKAAELCLKAQNAAIKIA